MKTYFKYLICFAASLTMIVACGKDDNNSGSGDQSPLGATVNTFSQPNASTNNSRKLSDYLYRLSNGRVSESVYVRAFWSSTFEIEISSLEVDGVYFGDGSYLDSSQSYMGPIEEDMQDFIEDLYDDEDKGKELWSILQEQYMGGAIIVIRGFSDPELAPFQDSEDKIIPINIDLLLDGKSATVKDEIKVSGRL